MNAEQAKFLAEHYARSRDRRVPDDREGAGGGERRQPRLQAGPEIAHRRGSSRRTSRPPTSGSSTVIIDGTFEFDPEAAKQAEAQFTTADDIVAFYKKTLPDKLKQLRATAGRQAGAGRRLLRLDEVAARAVPRLRQQPQHASPRPARRLPARDGLEGAVHLRRQRRRADAGRCAVERESVFPDLRAFIDRLRRDGDIVTVEAPVDPHLEVAEIHRRVIAAGGPALLFTNVNGSPTSGSSPTCSARRGAPSWRSASGRCG